MAAISSLISFLLTFGRNFLTWFYNMVIDGVNVAIVAMVDFAVTVVSAFPTRPPLTGAPSSGGGSLFDSVLTVLNWLFPMGYLVTVIGFLAAGMVAYWIIAPVARWVKLLN